MSVQKIKVNNSDAIKIYDTLNFDPVNKGLINSFEISDYILTSNDEINNPNYKITNTEIEAQQRIPGYIGYNKTITFYNGFYIDIYALTKNTPYFIISENHRHPGEYPLICFSNELKTEVNEQLDKALWYNEYANNDSKIYLSFCPKKDGYLYIACTYAYNYCKVFLGKSIYDSEGESEYVSDTKLHNLNLSMTQIGQIEDSNVLQYYAQHASGNTNIYGMKCTEYINQPIVVFPSPKQYQKSTLKIGIYDFDSVNNQYVKTYEQICESFDELLSPIQENQYIFYTQYEGGRYYTLYQGSKRFPLLLYRAENIAGNLLNSLDASLIEDISDNYNNLITVFQKSELTDKIIEMNTKINTLESQISELQPTTESLFKYYKKIGVIRNTLFDSSTLPSGWSNYGYTLSANGAKATSSGGIMVRLQYLQHSDLDSDCVTYVINATTAFRTILCRYHNQYPSSNGELIEFNMISKKIIVWEGKPIDEVPTTQIISFDIPFNFVAGEYTLSVSHYAEIKTFSIFGAGQTANFTYDTRTSDLYQRAHDNYGIITMDGDFYVKQAIFSSQLPAEPDVLVVGDSIGEADTICSLEGGGFENRWAGLLSQHTLCSIWAEGGNNSTHINGDLPVLTTLFRPRKVIYAIITNDGNYNTWLSNCQAFTQAFENIGAEVIYTTSVLRPVYETEHVKMTNWIKSSGHRYIDFRAAMTVDGLGQTRKNVFLPDQLHPNVEGHRIMFECIKHTLPDLFV